MLDLGTKTDFHTSGALFPHWLWGTQGCCCVPASRVGTKGKQKSMVVANTLIIKKYIYSEQSRGVSGVMRQFSKWIKKKKTTAFIHLQTHKHVENEHTCKSSVSSCLLCPGLTSFSISFITMRFPFTSASSCSSLSFWRGKRREENKSKMVHTTMQLYSA